MEKIGPLFWNVEKNVTYLNYSKVLDGFQFQEFFSRKLQDYELHQAATVLFTQNGLNNNNNNNNVNTEGVDENSASSSVVSTPRNSLRDDVRTAKFDVENDDDDNQVQITMTIFSMATDLKS